MNRQQMEVWLEAMLAEHAAGRLSTALLRGAFDVCDEVRRQWGRLAVERSHARYSPHEQSHSSLAQRLDRMHEEAEQKVYRNPTLRPPEKPQEHGKTKAWFQAATMQKIHAASVQILSKMELPISWSVCCRCGDYRAKGAMRIPGRELPKNAYLYVSAGQVQTWRWMAGICTGQQSEVPESHDWQPTSPPDFSQQLGDPEGVQS